MTAAGTRSVAERLREMRAASPLRSAPATIDDRAEVLARWFGARLSAPAGGRVVVVERRVSLPASAAAALGSLPHAAYFDTETTGLSTGAGTVIFLAGIGALERDELLVRQYLLPDYPHEAALLRGVASTLAAGERVVTYNGRAFDLPMLASRLTVHGLFTEQATIPARHDDLLPIARRLWRRALGGARLADVEAGVLNVRRSSDCPGSEVPLRYFGYLRGGSPDILAAVLDHNLQDVVSLALVEAELVRLRRGGWRDASQLDYRGMAIELLRAEAPEEAHALIDYALSTCHDAGDGAVLRRLATRLLLATGEVERAEAIWRDGTRRASIDAAAAWIEVARIRERHRGDLAGALEAASAASRVLDLAFALGRGGSMAAIARTRLRVDARLRRLRRWCAAAERRATRQAASRRVA